MIAENAIGFKTSESNFLFSKEKADGSGSRKMVLTHNNGTKILSGDWDAQISPWEDTESWTDGNYALQEFFGKKSGIRSFQI